MDTKREGEERRLAAWIGKAILVKGDIISSQDLVIDGKVEGRIELGDHNLTIGQGALVVANLVAKSVTISGTVTGNVAGNANVVLRSTGTVEGNVTAPQFLMEDGAVLHGTVEVAGKKPPS